MAVYICREGAVSSATWGNLATLGGATVNQIIVPPGCSSIKEIWTAVDMCVVTDAKGTLFGVKLTGSGMQGVDYETLAGGFTGGTATGNYGQSFALKASILRTNIAVAPGGEIWVQGAQVGTDSGGTANVAVTLVFASGGGSRRYSYIRWQSCATAVGATSQVAAVLDAVGGTANNIQLPQSAKRITNVVPCAGGVTLGAGNGGGVGLVKIVSGCTEGEQQFTAGGHGTELNTAGAGCGFFIPDPIATDIPVIGGASLAVTVGQGSGADWGTPYFGVAIEVET